MCAGDKVRVGDMTEMGGAVVRMGEPTIEEELFCALREGEDGTRAGESTVRVGELTTGVGESGARAGEAMAVRTGEPRTTTGAVRVGVPAVRSGEEGIMGVGADFRVGEDIV